MQGLAQTCLCPHVIRCMSRGLALLALASLAAAAAGSFFVPTPLRRRNADGVLVHLRTDPVLAAAWRSLEARGRPTTTTATWSSGTAAAAITPSAVPPSGNVTLSWSGVVNATSMDWVGVYTPAGERGGACIEVPDPGPLLLQNARSSVWCFVVLGDLVLGWWSGE